MKLVATTKAPYSGNPYMFDILADGYEGISSVDFRCKIVPSQGEICGIGQEKCPWLRYIKERTRTLFGGEGDANQRRSAAAAARRGGGGNKAGNTLPAMQQPASCCPVEMK